jgi:hypothetical protein
MHKKNVEFTYTFCSIQTKGIIIQRIDHIFHSHCSIKVVLYEIYLQMSLKYFCYSFILNFNTTYKNRRIVTVICVIKLSVDYCTIKRRWTSHSFHFRTYVKDRHKKKWILFEIKHGKLYGYIQKKNCENTGAYG